MSGFEKKEINEYQKKKFEEFERGSVVKFFEKYGDVLEKTAQKREIKILDIGGGSSNFALALSRYFDECGTKADIFVLDITRYPTWEQYGDKIHFVEGSAFDVENFFEQQSFDLIFVNYTFHHLVQKSWQKTLAGFGSLLMSIHKLLKHDGVLCVSECYYEILFMKGFSSWLVYTLSTIRIPMVAKLLRRIGSKSSGVGVCFLPINKWRTIFQKTGYGMEEVMKSPTRFMKRTPVRERFFCFVLVKTCRQQFLFCAR